MYDFLRELADSWGLLFMFLVFIGVLIWVWRPGSRALHRDIADIPLRNDEIGEE